MAIEPLSENALKLQGEGYKQSAKVDDAVKTAEQVLALPADVKASDFAADRERRDADAHGHRPGGPDAGGQADRAGGGPDRGRVPERRRAAWWPSQEAQIPQLAAGASQDVKVAGQGSGITAWRYKRK